MKAKLALIAFLLFLFCFSFAKPTFAAISFSISNIQYQSDEISADVSLSGLTSASCPTGSCYLQGAFTAQSGNPRYFGFTKNHLEEFYEYNGTPDLTYIKSIFFAFPFQASWSGKLIFKSNPNSPDYNGPGQYSLKVWRYTGNSSSPAGDPSNILSVNLTAPVPIPQQTNLPPPTEPSTSPPTVKPISTPTSLPSPTKTPTPKPTSSTPSPTHTSVLGISQSPSQSVLGDSDEKTREQTKAVVPGESKSKAIGIIFIFLGIIFLSLCGIVFFLSYRNSLKTNGA